MTTRLEHTVGWVALLCGIATIFAMVTTVLFFWLEAPSAGSGYAQPHLWGPLSDLFPIVQMALLLVVAYGLFQVQRHGAPTASLVAAIVGAVGMLGVMALQSLLLLDAIPFEREIGPMLLATALVGAWLLVVNTLARQQGTLPSWLPWLGIAVGIAFVLEPVLLSAMGGTVNWQAMTSNTFLLAASALVFLVAYVGFPIWVIGLGRVFLASGVGSASAFLSQRVG